MTRHRWQQTLLHAALTAILVGYFTVWLPGPAAGLQLIGFELGEWIKFLGVGSRRDLFYLPPITLGLALILLTAGGRNRRWETWALRGLGAAVSLLALPALQIIALEPPDQWLLRLALIALVWVSALLLALGTRGGDKERRAPGNAAWPWAALALLALAGSLLPTWQYLAVRPLVTQILGQPVGIGLGVWLNASGHLVAAVVGLREWRRRRRLRRMKYRVSPALAVEKPSLEKPGFDEH